MSIFLATFFLLYGLMHAYTFIKARAALAFGAPVAALILFGVAFMVAAPVLVRFAELRAPDHTARILGFIGYTWMGLVFVFVCSALAIDLFCITVRLMGNVSKTDLSYIAPAAKAGFYLPLVCAVFVVVYGFLEASRIRTEEVVIKTAKISPQLGTLRIAQISDVHLGLLVRERRLERILDQVRRADPDIVVSTGDLVDGQRNSLNGLDKYLRDVKPPYGKFAVTGNHEFYAGIGDSLDFTEKAGFTVLRGEAVQLGDRFSIVGVDDPAGPGYGRAGTEGEKGLLSKTNQDHFILLLKHRPSVNPDCVGLFDLQLSGHVHGGQVFPFGLFVHLFYPYSSGYHSLGQGSSLSVSRGSGTWGPPIRFLAPPEVTIITLIHDDKARNSEMAK
ncbi:MAG TPA: metallophosphoesterase [Deltaproteobacteria bacterium]|nr:metallophosphoesterase [Deltaproteobacteria bacterium]